MKMFNRTVGVVLAASATLVAGCDIQGDQGGGGVQESEAPAVASENGLSSINGLSSVNGLSSLNGLSSVNGLSSLNGLSSVNGLSSLNGLITADGQKTMSYIVRCALPAGRTITMKNTNGTPIPFAGQLGLAPGWETKACDTNCQEAISACVLAHVNTSGEHISLWLDGPDPALGWGQSSNHPYQEGTFFGNIFTSPPSAFFCNGRDHAFGVVPGRLGATQTGSPYTNPYGQDVLCRDRCTAAGGPSNTDGFSSCPSQIYGRPAYKHTVTVYRNYEVTTPYKICDKANGMCLDATGSTAGAAVVQNSYNASDAGQKWTVAMVSPGKYKIIHTASGLALGSSGGKTTAGTALALGAYTGAPTQIFSAQSMADGTGYQSLIFSAGAMGITVPNNGVNTPNLGIQLQTYNYMDSQKWGASLAK